MMQPNGILWVFPQKHLPVFKILSKQRCTRFCSAKVKLRSGPNTIYGGHRHKSVSHSQRGKSARGPEGCRATAGIQGEQ
eukprot:2053046-Amphidinium_carterae.1